MEMDVPAELPVMTLSEAVFFPNTLLPLRIFEPRYRRMLSDVLASHRMFGIVNLDPDNAASLAKREPPHAWATAGIVRSCQKNADGTSEVLLQGVSRVRVDAVLRETPYRVLSVAPMVSTPGAPEPEILIERKSLLEHLRERQELGCRYPAELADFLENLTDCAAVSDLTAHLFCPCSSVRQELLSTLSVHDRLRRLNAYLLEELQTLRLKKYLGGSCGDSLGSN
jgi:uncharacterized protein